MDWFGRRRYTNRLHESGQIMIVAAVALPVLMGIGGLALDLSYLYGQRQATQLAADAAAQAGAIALAKGKTQATAQTDAVNYAKSNGFAIATSNVTFPTTSQVKVAVSLHVNPILSGVYRPTGFSSTVSAVADATDPMGISGSMWVLDPSGSSLQTTGNGCVDVNGGIFVDSSSSTAILQGGHGGNCPGGEVNVKGTSISEVGGVSTASCCSPTPTKLASAVADPLANIIMPYYSNGHWYSGDGTQLSAGVVSNSGTTYSPGVYNTINLSTAANYTFNPGIYVIDGSGGLGFSATGQATLAGKGVFFYNANSTTPASCGPINIAGQGSVNLSAPTSGLYEGILIAQDRNCATAATIGGNGSITADGALYFPDALLTVAGNGTNSAAMVIAKDVTATGNGTTFDPANQSAPPNVPSAILTQ